MTEDLSIFDNIMYFLNDDGCEYELMEHEFVHSSEDAAKIRGTNLEEAAKALVMQGKKDGKKFFFMCVVSGHKRLDLKKIKVMLECKNVSLASPEDVLKVTGLEIGKVPPFPFLFDLEGYVDQGVLDNEFVVFSAGSHFKSVRMLSEDWKELAGVQKESIADC